MSKFNIKLLLFVAAPVCLFAAYRGYEVGNPYVFIVGVLGSAFTLFFGLLFVIARKKMKPLPK